ncbi:MAG: carboxymuconolactone decarboxylase family protein [Verrucomicrobiae bacterium]|nr:carboxymuconolactone decarboxylase family protein [Verrucomicrobiae bacterium]
MNDPSNAPCCAHAAPSPANDSSPAGGGGSGLQTRFMDFLKTVNAPGALDAHTKQALALALSVLARCEPCVKAHLQKARAMGFTEEEIDEAAWMAIAFGGSPVMMFYNTVYAAK